MSTEELQAELDALYKADGKKLVDAWILDSVWETYKHRKYWRSNVENNVYPPPHTLMDASAELE